MLNAHTRLCALLSMLSMSASAASFHLPLHDPALLLVSRNRVEMQRSPRPAASAFVYAFARAGERASDLAAAYGVDPQSLTVDTQAKLSKNAVLRLEVTQASPERRLPPGVQSYTVQPGDTVEALAHRHGLSTLELLSANLDTASLDRLAVGQELLIPTRERGLLLRLKPGDSALSLIQAYRADPAVVARVNQLDPAHLLRPGDYLLLPGVQAKTLMAELLARRERARQQQLAQARQAQYERYLAYQQEKKRRALEALYQRQAAFEKYQAYLKSPERKALQAKYDQQAKYEAYLAAQEQERQARIAAAKAATRQARATPPGAPTLRRAAFGDAGIIWPMQSYRITSRFGERDIEFHQQFFHGGVDLAAPAGTPIHAATDGVVTQAGYGDFGLNVWMKENDATVIYGHMSRLAVSAGQSVRQGQLVGYVGCTGFCTGPHLHFEVRLNGQAVDPLGLLP